MISTIESTIGPNIQKAEEPMRDPQIAALLDAIHTRLKAASTPERLTLIQRLYETIDIDGRPDPLIKHFG